MKRNRTIIALILSVCIAITPASHASAQELSPSPEILQYTDINGNTINYYLGTDGNPYTTINGEQVLVALPLEQYMVTDKETRNELYSLINSETALLTAEPTNYYDISDCPLDEASSAYSKDIDFSNGSVNTDYIKISLQHSMVRLQTTNINKANIFAGKKINYTFYYYSGVEEEWYNLSVSDIDCSLSNGAGVQIAEGLYPYIYYNISKSSNLKSVTANIWTAPYWYWG